MTLLPLATILLSCFTLPSRAFTFHFTSIPTQCANTTVDWTGGQAPFTFLLVPTGHLYPETRKIIQKDIPSGNSVSFVLNFPAGSQFVAVLNDATGIGAGGTSKVTSVASSYDSSCLTTTQSEPKFFLHLPGDIEQCDSVDISWDSQAEAPVDILGVVPAGESFEIANVTDSSTSFDWTANVRSGAQVMFVAGDKDGLGTGGSSDVMQLGEGDSDGCINDNSPSSTTGDAAGGVSSTTQGQADTQTTAGPSTGGGDLGGSTGIVTTDNAGSTVTVEGTLTTDNSGTVHTIVGSTGIITTTDNAGSTVTIIGPAGPITTTDNAGSTVTVGATTPIVTTDNSGSTITIGSGSSTFPGSRGGTVTGSSNNSLSDGVHNKLGFILGLIFGLLGLGLVIGGIVFYRRRRTARAYINLEGGGNNASRPRPWVTALTRSAHIRGGANSSVDTLPSMYQTEPFILPSEHEPYYIPHMQEPPLVQQPRPDLVARASSARSISSLLGEGPFIRDVFGGALAGMHGPDRKDSAGPHGRTPSRTPSGRVTTQRSVPPPVTTDLPTRVTRDSEDFSPEPEVMSPNPFDDPVVEIPPTYASVRRASRSNDREPWQPARARLSRANASRYSQRSRSSDI